MTNIGNGVTNQDVQMAISDIAAQQQQLYSREPRELISHYNRETSALDGYRGRQILELLQNADDAGVGATDSSHVTFFLDRQRLVVANTGNPFTHDGLMSLVISDCSPKQLEQNRFIGCKGLGFRAVLTWTDRPLILSGSLRVLFDKSVALHAVEELARNNHPPNHILEFYKSVGRWPVPVMRFPSAPENDDPDLKVAQRFQAEGFTTVVVLPIPSGERGDAVLQEARAQLQELSTTALLFCSYLVEVKIDGVVKRNWSLLREKVDQGRSRVIVSDGEIDRYWDIYRRSGKVSAKVARESSGGHQEFETAIAVPESPDVPCDSHTLCVFFPTREHLPCPIVMHATLETTEDRNRVVNNASNRQVFTALAEHLSSVIEQHVSIDTPLRTLRLLDGVQNADPELDELGFVDAVRKAIRTRPILPRLDGRLGTAEDSLKAPYDVWFKVANGEYFPEMLAVSSDYNLDELIEWLGLQWLEADILKARLRLLLTSLEPAVAGDIVGQLMDANQLRSIGVNGLLLERKGSLVSETEECFFNPTEKLPPLPAWARDVRFMDAAFQAALLQSSGTSTLRGLVGTLERNKAKVSEYRFDTVARAVISRLNADSEAGELEHQERWRELIPWLFHASEGSRQVLSQLAVNVITTKGSLKRATSCYLSDHYSGGKLVAKLYEPLHQDEFVASPRDLGLSGIETTQVEKFLVSLGVQAVPRDVPFRYVDDTYLSFREHVVDTLPFPISVRSRTCESPAEVRQYCCDYEITGLHAPDRFVTLLTKGDPVAIVAYLMSDGQMHLSNERADTATFEATVDWERKLRADHSVPIPNPVLFWLRETAWIPSEDGKKRRPAEIMLSSTGLRILPGVYFRHIINYKDNLIQRGGGRRAVDTVLLRLGAVGSLETMDSEQVYDLLLSLPNRDPQGKSVSSIYRTLLESRISIEEGPNRTEFLRCGRVWAKLRGVSQYLPIQDVRYNANVTLPRVVGSRVALLDLPIRRSAKAVDQLLNVKQLTSKDVQLAVEPDGTEYDINSEDANAFLHRCIPYVYALRLGKKLDDNFRERNLLKKASLRVCNRLVILFSVEGYAPETLVLDRDKDRIAIESQLYIVGKYDPNSAGVTSFWLSVAGLVAEVLGTDVEAEVGAILRCRSEREMREVVEALLGTEAEEKLDEAHRRFDDWVIEESKDDLISIPPDDEGDSQLEAATNEGEEKEAPNSPDEPTGEDDGGRGEIDKHDADAEKKFKQTEGPEPKSRKRRRLVIHPGGCGSGGGGRGPIATEDVTFRIIEDFERQDGTGRFVIDVSKIQGKDGLGCDLISVKSQDLKEKALTDRVICESNIERFIEVKGRSSRTGDVELTENEYNAAQKHKERYYLYRVFVDPVNPSIYEVAILQDPVHSNATRTVTRFDLSRGSGAVWYGLEETVEEA